MGSVSLTSAARGMVGVEGEGPGCPGAGVVETLVSV